MKRLLFDGTATQGYGNTNYHGGGEYAKYYLRNALYEGFDFDIVFQNKSFTDPQILELLQQYPNIKIFWVNNLDEIYSLIKEKGILVSIQHYHINMWIINAMLNLLE